MLKAHQRVTLLLSFHFQRKSTPNLVLRLSFSTRLNTRLIFPPEKPLKPISTMEQPSSVTAITIPA